MTRSQFAIAVMADEKWVENAPRLLGRRLAYTENEARWYALVRLFNQDIGVTLSRAALLADEALTYPAEARTIILGKTTVADAGISIDRALFESSFGASLSVALDMGGPKRRGRMSRQSNGRNAVIRRALQYGVDIGLLQAGLKLSVRERLKAADENAEFVTALRPSRTSR
jgi:hypothetical protein